MSGRAARRSARRKTGAVLALLALALALGSLVHWVAPLRRTHGTIFAVSVSPVPNGSDRRGGLPGDGAASSPPSQLTPSPAPSRPLTPALQSMQPQGGLSHLSLSGPIRAAFYYPWFPETWGRGAETHYQPELGFYSSSNPAVIRAHIAAMRYGKIQAGIASWWGQGSLTDGRVLELLGAAHGTTFRWALYYEQAGLTDPSAPQIQSDMNYILSRYAADPNFLYVNGKPVLFVYGGSNQGCTTVTKWVRSNAGRFYLVLKAFSGFEGCRLQPDQWHQYAPALAQSHVVGHSFAVSPGFWKYNETAPRLGRDVARWIRNIQDMVASGETWQLVTTFNEFGEGTAVEVAREWETSSAYGSYLDALHSY